MGFSAVFGILWTVISRKFTGRGLSDTVDLIAQKYVALKDSESEVEKAEIERDIIQMEMIAKLQEPSSKKLYSPMMFGQYLIVVPFGIWWASICLISVIKPLWVDGKISVDDLPPHIFEMAYWLVPAIVIGTALGGKK